MSETETLTQTEVGTRTLKAGTVIGTWLLVRPLGRGAFGQTWLCQHVVSQQVAVLKALRLEHVEDWKSVELFEREIATLKALQHPLIPRLLDSGGIHEGQPWLVMEHRPGQSLSERIKAGQPLSERELHHVASSLLDVLGYLQAQPSPVVHRDIKPSNILLDSQGQVSLIDFGSVRQAYRPDGGSTVAGTFGYLAPEQLHGDASPQSDLYSLGITLTALATGVDGAVLPRQGLRVDLDRVLPNSPWLPLLRALTSPEPSQRPAHSGAARALFPGMNPAAHSQTQGRHASDSLSAEAKPTAPPFPLNLVVMAFWLFVMLSTLFGGWAIKLGKNLVLGTGEFYFKRKLRKAERKQKRRDIQRAQKRLTYVQDVRKWVTSVETRLYETSAYASQRVRLRQY